MNTAEVTRLVRAELERGDIPAEVLSNNTIEARGHFITTVVLVEQSVRGGEHGRVQVFIDGQPRCGFGYEVEVAEVAEAGEMSTSDGLDRLDAAEGEGRR